LLAGVVFTFGPSNDVNRSSSGGAVAASADAVGLVAVAVDPRNDENRLPTAASG